MTYVLVSESLSCGRAVPIFEASEPTPAEVTKAAFRTLIVDAVEDDSLDIKATMKKIKDIMAVQSKLSGIELPAESSTPASSAMPDAEAMAKPEVETEGNRSWPRTSTESFAGAVLGNPSTMTAKDFAKSIRF